MIRKIEGNDQLTAMECERLRPNYLGPLFKKEFYRVILDEGHAIKNHQSQSSYFDSAPYPHCTPSSSQLHPRRSESVH